MLHDRNPLFVTLSDGSIRNGYTLKLLNMIPELRTVICPMEGLPGADMSVVGVDQPADRSLRRRGRAGQADAAQGLRAPAARGRRAASAADFSFIVEDTAEHETDDYVATFNAPETAR